MRVAFAIDAGEQLAGWQSTKGSHDRNEAIRHSQREIDAVDNNKRLP
jgi:hypothetical protein